MPEEVPAEVRQARREIASLARERDRLVRDAARAGRRIDLTALTGLDDSIAGVLDRIRPLVDPCDASPTEPLVLLPVRLETRYADGPGGTAILKVRIYPDEIHLDELVRGLTDAEVLAGQTYWTAVWTDPVTDGAFRDLVAAVTPQRAEWVAHRCRPTNLADRGNGAPTFAPVDPVGARNIVARALPDRFVVVVRQGDRTARTVGAAVPRDLPVNPIALPGDDTVRRPDQLTVPAGSEWLTDFDAAVTVGMAVTVALPAGRAPIERVVALGTRASSSAREGADELADVLTGHRFSDGFGLLTQGTATNNADRARSPYRARPEPVPPALVPSGPVAGSDASAVATALGVDPAAVTDLAGPGDDEQELARDVNTCLWAPGWGEYLGRLDAQGLTDLTDAQRESARQLFRDQVRGRGPVPAVRVGAQPYGILPVSDLTRWAPRPRETTAGIHGVVARLLPRWDVAAGRVDTLRPGASAVDESLLEIMGTSPVMLGLRARPFLSDDVSDPVIAALGLDRAAYDAEARLLLAVMAQAIDGIKEGTRLGSLHPQDRPIPLPLASDRDPEFIAALLDTPSRVLAVDSVLQALLALAWDSTDLDAARMAPARVLPSLVEAIALEPGLRADVLSLIGRADSADHTELLTLSRAVGDAFGVEASGTSVQRRYRLDATTATSLAEVALAAPPVPETELVAVGALAGWLRAMGYRSEVRTAMQALTGTTTAHRERAVAESLDCSSHRLDAWATGIVSDRLATLAGSPGATIGAYGVVEDLSPQAGAGADGWIHAPSSRHAVAAGILRSAHLGHLPDDGTSGPFALDLSSVRLGPARRALEAVRQGQQLAAVIGYQIERGLADARLARLHLSLRTLAPLVAGRLSDSDGQDDEAAKQTVAANNVVDGLLLLRRYPAGSPALRAALTPPPVNAYLDPADWEPLTDAEWSAVTRVMATAADTVDAVSDLLLAESVLQYAGGNPTRAAAAMDAMSSGASPAAELDILDTQDSAERLGQRVLALVGPGAASAWATDRPRALAEPALEAWASAHLGPPTTIVVGTGDDGPVTLDAAGMCALDVVHAAGPAALERVLRQRIPSLAGRALATTPDPGWAPGLRSLGQAVTLAVTLRELIAGGSPVLPDSLTRPGERPVRDLDGSIAPILARLGSAAGMLAAAVTGLEPVIATLPADGIVPDEPTAQTYLTAVLVLDGFGVPLDPGTSLPLDLAWVRSAWESAVARSTGATALLTALQAAQAAQPPVPAALLLDQAEELAAAIFGAGFRVVPTLGPAAGDAFSVAVSTPTFPAPSPSALRRLVRDLGTSREQVRRYSEVLLVGSALGSTQAPVAVQLTERNADGPVAGTERWLAGRLDPAVPWPASPAAHLIVDAAALGDGSGPLAGLVIDAWVEDVPAQPRAVPVDQIGPPGGGAAADPPAVVPPMATTALAVQANAASARAPQAILSAVSPDGSRWTTDALVGVIDQTLRLARHRLVRLDQLAGEGLALPALYVRSSSLQGELALTFANLVAASKLVNLVPYVKEP